MSTLAVPPSRPPIVYPDSDGKPMAENTLQYQLIVTITGGLEHLFADDPNVFVAGDLFWYPVEGNNKIRLAPDTLVAFGRPKGHRGSYRQWLEGGVAPQVVFEVISPGNRFGEMSAKFDFYRRYGVEEYYLYDPDPDRLELSGFLRHRDDLVEIETMHGHVSPRLKVRFEMGEDGLRIIRPDGQRFVTFLHEDHDRVTKLEWYATARIPHYWLLTGFERSSICHVLDGNQYVQESAGTDEDIVRTRAFGGISIPLDKVWDVFA